MKGKLYKMIILVKDTKVRFFKVINLIKFEFCNVISDIIL